MQPGHSKTRAVKRTYGNGAADLCVMQSPPPPPHVLVFVRVRARLACLHFFPVLPSKFREKNTEKHKLKAIYNGFWDF